MGIDRRGDNDCGRILIARIGALGDTLMATPVIRAFRQACPTARIDFLASAAAAPLLEHHPDLNRVLALRQRNVPYWLAPEKWRLAADLRRAGYHRTVLLESAPRYLELLHHAGLKQIAGFPTTPSDPQIHSAANNLKAAGFEDWKDRRLDSDLYFPVQSTARPRELLDGLPRPIVGIHPGYGPAQKKVDQAARLKGWPTASFQELVTRLLESEAGVVVTGSPEDRPEAERIAAPNASNAHLRVAAGATSVLELAALIAEVDLFISVDSGPAHMAAAVGTPLVVLWGPAKLHQVQPISNRSPVIVLSSEAPCAPCYDTPEMKACRDNICMKEIDSSQVFAAAWRVLSNPGETP